MLDPILGGGGEVKHLWTSEASLLGWGSTNILHSGCGRAIKKIVGQFPPTITLPDIIMTIFLLICHLGSSLFMDGSWTNWWAGGMRKRLNPLVGVMTGSQKESRQPLKFRTRGNFKQR